MKRIVRFGCGFVLAASVVIAAVGCSSSDGTPQSSTADVMKGRLQDDTGARWDVDLDPESGAPFLYFALDPTKPISPKADPAEILAFLNAYKDTLGVSDFTQEFQLEARTVSSLAGVVTLRYVQRVPGSDLPIFDGHLVVNVNQAGGLSFIQTGFARELVKMSTKPTLSSDDAKRAAGGAVADDPMLGVHVDANRIPHLAYLVLTDNDDGPRRMMVSAADGAVLFDETRAADGTSTTARAAAASYDNPTDPGFDGSATFSVEYDDLTADGTVRLNAGGATPLVSLIMAMKCRKLGRSAAWPPECWHAVRLPAREAALTPSDWGFFFVERVMDKDGVERDATFMADAAGETVDAQVHVRDTRAFFAEELGHMKWAPAVAGNRDTVYLHHEVGAATDGNAFYIDGTRGIFFGHGVRSDGEHRATGRYALYPPATVVDFVAHEYTHGVIHGITAGDDGRVTPLGHEREAGALNEALADVFSAYAEMRDARTHTYPKGEEPNWKTFAERQTADHKGLRNFVNPFAIKPTAPNGTASKNADLKGAAAHVSGMQFLKPGEKPSEANDFGHVHDNSTVVSHAWANMAFGSSVEMNPHTNIVINEEIGFDRAKKLWWDTLQSLTPQDRSFKAFADKMIAYQVGLVAEHPVQRDLSPMWVKRTIVCSWVAVGVIPRDEALRNHQFQCTDYPAGGFRDTCEGRVDGWFCSPVPGKGWQSYRCQGGTIADTHDCEAGTYCHRLLGAYTSFAVPDTANPFGPPMCFPQPQDSDLF